MHIFRLKTRSQGSCHRMMGASFLSALLLFSVASADHREGWGVIDNQPSLGENYKVTYGTFLGQGATGVIVLVLAILACIACCCCCCCCCRRTRNRGAIHQPAQLLQGDGHLYLQQPGGYQPGGYAPEQPGGYQPGSFQTPQEVACQHQAAGYYSHPGQEQIAPPGYSGYPSQLNGYPQEPPGYPSQPPPYPGPPEPFPTKESQDQNAV